MNRTIAVDIDDVLAISVQGWVDYSNQKWGTHLTVDDYDEDWAKMWKIDHDQARQRALHLYDIGLVGTFDKFKDAEAVLRWLAKYYTLVITTSRVRHVQDVTLEWIDRHFKGIFKEIHFAGFYDDFKRNAVKQTKAELLKSIGAEYIIDDHPKHCMAAAEAGVKALLFGDYLWSRHLTDLPDNVIRVRDWHEIKEYFAHELNS